MDEITDERWQQAARVLSGEATAEERSGFEQWLGSSSAHRRWFASLQTIWESRGDDGEGFDVDTAWTKVRQRMNPSPNRQPRRDRRATRPSRGIPNRIAALMAVLLVAVGLAWWLADAPPNAPTAEPQLLTTDTGERTDVRLADGTRVTLAPQTSLEIAAAFGTSTREVILHGEAMFDVTPDADRPFVVTTTRGSIRVVGTRFVVRDYDGSNEPFEVAVDEGTVEAGASGETARVRAGQVATRSARGLEVQAIVDPAVHFGWTDGRLAFRDSRMQHVAASLERWYGLEIVFGDTAIASRRLTANFEETRPDDVMNVIALTIDARLEREGTAYLLRPAHAD